MVTAWLFHEDNSDKREPHQPPNCKFIDFNNLKKETGVLYWKLDAENYEKEGKLSQIRKERNYSYNDLIDICPEKLPNYEEQLKIFYQEHLHESEEIRFILEGSGYFDVRDIHDNWVRILVEKGDLIVLPPGIYHRFTLDTKNYAKVMRLFIGQPNWIAFKRPADDHPARKVYLDKAKDNFQE